MLRISVECRSTLYTAEALMRMKELASRAELPRTTIHYYLREGLLPQPDKAAANAAQYSEEHLQRLQLIQRLRSGAGGALPVTQIRRVIDMIERGVEPDLAVALHRAVLGEGQLPVQDRLLSLAEVATQIDVDEEEIRKLVDASLVIPVDHHDPMQFDAADAEMAGQLITLCQGLGCQLEELAPIAVLIREISQQEMALRNRVVEGLDAQEEARRSLVLQRTGGFLHTYLFARNRQHDIAVLRDRSN